MTSCSKELGPLPKPKRPLQITTRTLKEPDFKFELLPLHSPLLGQSLLVSFPPLIDMLKFSGYPYLIRGQSQEDCGGLTAGTLDRRQTREKKFTTPGPPGLSARWISEGLALPLLLHDQNPKRDLSGF